MAEPVPGGRCLCPPHTASSSRTVVLEGALSWFWSISYTWRAVKPFRSRDTSSVFSGTIYSFRFMDFAGGSLATAGLDSQQLNLTWREPCSMFRDPCYSLVFTLSQLFRPPLIQEAMVISLSQGT